MKKNILLFVFVCFINLLFSHDILAFAKSTTNKNPNNEFLNSGFSLFTNPPVVSSPIYYCQGSPALPLTATAAPGGTLNWYGTFAIGGVNSGTAPTPSTATVGTTSYYVSQTVAGVESTRSKIDVVVVANNGATILNLKCDPSQILPADKASSVFFDWSNNPLISNTYSYSYTIQGGPVNAGTVNVSHLQVFGMLPGQSATLILSSTTHPCVPPQTITCSVPCGASTVTPNFAAIAPFCSGTNAPLLGSTSPNGIKGTWSPAIVSNTTSASYTFTPDPILFPCATTQVLSVTVIPKATPTFSSIPSTICQNAPVLTLPLNSDNSTPISGTWFPATVNTSVLGTFNYAFTANPGQCVVASPIAVSITIVPANIALDFQWTITEAFEENQIITIIPKVSGGDYVYQLDDGPFQSSPVFEHVSSGSHFVTMADQTGCSTSVTMTDILVINYPKYFTPNNDGYNDNWNVSELSDQSTSVIHIFDRYGKLLKEIRPNGNGWNGTFNGRPLPADDYWFVIHYTEDNVYKQFKSHFSLKR